MKNYLGKMLLYISMLVFTVSLTACGDDDDNNVSATKTLSGTAATGAAIVGTVQVTDADGDVSDVVTINADGSYTVIVTGMTAPFIVTATAAGGEVYYSYAAAPNITVNVTQLTTLALAIAANGDPANLLANWSTQANTVTDAEITEAAQIVYANLVAQFSAAGLDDTDYNFFNDEFTADSTGLDLVLDGITITYDFTQPIANAFTIMNGVITVPFTITVDLSGFDFGDDDGTGGTAACGSGDSDLPAAIKDKAITMLFSTTGANGTAPYADGDTLSFVFCGNGALLIGDDTIATTYTTNVVSATVTTISWIDTDDSLKYEVALLSGALHEVNLNSPDNTVFYGQLTETTTGGGSGTAEGTWNLVITGQSCVSSLACVNIPAITVLNIPAPEDIGDVEAEVANQASGFDSLVVTPITDTATEKSFGVEYEITVQGPITTTTRSDLVYTYTQQ